MREREIKTFLVIDVVTEMHKARPWLLILLTKTQPVLVETSDSQLCVVQAQLNDII